MQFALGINVDYSGGMELIIDPDVRAVAEFMQGSMPAAKLVEVAAAVASMAPILWGQYAPEPVQALRLNQTPPVG